MLEAIDSHCVGPSIKPAGGEIRQGQRAQRSEGERGALRTCAQTRLMALTGTTENLPLIEALIFFQRHTARYYLKEF
jgi:hypothetical protein